MSRRTHRRGSSLLAMIIAGMLIIASGCASTHATTSTFAIRQTGALSDGPRADVPSDVITAADLHDVVAANTAEAVRRLRPNFVRPSPVPGSMQGDYASPSVYVDGNYLGGIDALDLVHLDEVEEIRFIRANAAKNWWGGSCPCAVGVIHVRTRHAR
jgi:hypothetical protein